MHGGKAENVEGERKRKEREKKKAKRRKIRREGGREDAIPSKTMTYSYPNSSKVFSNIK